MSCRFAIAGFSFFLLPEALLALALLHVMATGAGASALLPPSAGSADAAAAGATIAEPLSPAGAQFSNPAGLARFTRTAIGTGLGLAYGRGEVTGTRPAGYHADNEVLVPFLNTFVVVPRGNWTFGLGTLGTSGARFDYGARPELGVGDGFFSETGILGLPIGAAYRVSDKLWIGAELIVLYGSAHLRFSREVAERPGVATPFRFTTEGFGVHAMFGVTWKPHENLSLGISGKPPGKVWADGDSRLDTTKQDVELDLEMPAEALIGLTADMTSRWRLSYALRFVDTSRLSSSFFRFEDTPSADMPYVRDARDEWRHAIGIEYAWSDTLTLLGGYAHANSIVGSSGVTPSCYDSEDDRLSAGFHRNGDTWNVDGGFGFLFGGTRRIREDDAVLPGTYDSKPAYLLSLTLTKKF